LKKKVLISGGSRGIGRATALFLKSKDYEVLSPGTQDLDVSKQDSIDLYFDKNFSEKDSLYALISNAGVFHSSRIENYSDSDWERVLNVNLTGAFRLCRKALDLLKKSPEAKIIFISSVSALFGEAYASAYSASKAGLHGLTKSLALELAPDNIQVNAICPGWVKTDMALKQLKNEEEIKNQLGASLQNRWICSEEVASLVAYLISEDSRAITGQLINFSAGLYI
jgi:3-oxoacyl-[acyl-carrier protein] reductase